MTYIQDSQEHILAPGHLRVIHQAPGQWQGLEKHPMKTTTSVLITGANRGLGLEWARQYAEAGWRVLATCRRPEEAGDLKALTRNAQAFQQALRVARGDI